MSVAAETLWSGGPRQCLLHRPCAAGSRRPGTHSNPQGFKVPSAPCNSTRPARCRLVASQPCGRQPCRSLGPTVCHHDWKHRRRKSSICRTDIHASSSYGVASPGAQHSAFFHVHHQLDRRRRRCAQATDEGSNAASSDDHPASVPTWSDAATPDPPADPPLIRFAIDRDLEADEDDREPQPTEAGILPEGRLPSGQSKLLRPPRAAAPVAAKARESVRAVSNISTQYATHAGLIYSPAQRNQIKESWSSLMRWSRVLHGRSENGTCALERIDRVVVFGGGSFGTAMAAALARQKARMEVVLLLRDPYICQSINQKHENSRYLEGYKLPQNLTATTSTSEAILGAQYAVHALPVQQTRSFLHGIKDVLPPDVPVISVSKGLELGTGKLMSEIIPAALGRKQPAVFLSGPSFAREVMDLRPTAIVAASKDIRLAREVQQLFASPTMRVNTTSDVIGVELCGSLKNVLAIAAGIVEGLELGHNAMAALVTQGCSEIRWLAEKAGAKPATISGLSGLGDIMLTCYGSLSRNRAVGVKLGQGVPLEEILKTSKQVAEGVSTAGVVVGLGRKYRVSLPVLTAVAQVLNSHLRADQAVAAIMNFPQIEER